MVSEDSVFLSHENNCSASSALSNLYVDNLFDLDVEQTGNKEMTDQELVKT